MGQYFKVGKFVAAHGLLGEVLLKHSFGKKTSLKGLTAIFTEERKASFIPWFIEAAKVKNEDEVFLKLENIHTRELAIRLIKKEVWVTEADYRKFASKQSPANYLGYVVIDQEQDLGEILEVIEQPQQLVCRLEINKKEVLIPLNEETLQSIDHRKKRVLVKLPDGLLDIYLA